MVLCRWDARRGGAREEEEEEGGRALVSPAEGEEMVAEADVLTPGPSHGGTGGSAGLVQPQRSAQPAREIHLLHLGALDEGVTHQHLQICPFCWVFN